jgi:hypothetical protein
MIGRTTLPEPRFTFRVHAHKLCELQQNDGSRLVTHHRHIKMGGLRSHHSFLIQFTCLI